MGTAPALVFYCWGKSSIILTDGQGERAWEKQSIGICGLDDRQSFEQRMRDERYFIERILEVLCGRTRRIRPFNNWKIINSLL